MGLLYSMRNIPALKIGLFLETLNDSCESKIASGVIDSVNGKDIQLYIFEGAFYCSYLGFDYQYDLIKETILKFKLDGLIIGSSFMLEYFEESELEQYLSNFFDIPTVSLSIDYKGQSSIGINIESGLKMLLNHLIKCHKCKDFAIVTGPKNHYETRDNLKVIQNIFIENNIEYKPDHIYYSDLLTKPSGIKSGEELLNNLDTLPEAIICFDDNLAIGLITYFENRGIVVPDDVIVTGIDDIQEADTFHVPLTTIKQPFYDMGRESVNLILDSLYKKKRPQRLMLNTYLIVRNSCRCFTTKFQKLEESTKKNIVSYFDIINSISHITDEEKELFYNLLSKLPLNEKLEVNKTREVICAFLKEYKNQIFIGQILRKISRHLLSFTNLARDKYIALQEIVIVLDQIILNYEFKENSKHKSANWSHNFGTQLLLNSYNIEDLSDKLNIILTEIDIDLFILYTFEKASDQLSEYTPDYSKLLVAYYMGENIKSRYKEKELTQNIYQRKYFKGINQLFLPLYLNNEYIGFIITEYKPEKSYNNYRALRINIGNAIKNSIKISEEKDILNKKLDLLYSISNSIKNPLTISLNAIGSFKKKNINYSNNRDLELAEYSIKEAISDLQNFIGNDLFYQNHYNYLKKDTICITDILKNKIDYIKEDASKKCIGFNFNTKKDFSINTSTEALTHILFYLFDSSLKYSVRSGNFDIDLIEEDSHILLIINNPTIDFNITVEDDEYNNINYGYNKKLKIVKEILLSLELENYIRKSDTGFNIKILFPKVANIIKTYDTVSLNSSSNETILILENDLHLLELLVTNLSYKYKVIPFKDAKNVSSYLKTNRIPDLIITNSVLNGIDNSILDIIPIIFLTNDRDKIDILRLGVLDCIEKPFSFVELFTKVDNFIKLSRSKQRFMILNFEESLSHSFSFIKNSFSSDQIELKLLQYREKLNLNERDIKLVKYLCIGKSHKEISSLMDLSNSTVRNLSHHIYTRFNVSNKKELKEIVKNL